MNRLTSTKVLAGRIAEEFAMGAGRLLPAADVDQHDAGTDDILQPAAGFFDGVLDDLDAGQGLAVEIAGIGGAAAGGDGGRS
jgi:hypothetical protein